MSGHGDLGRRDYLILKLAVKKGWLEPSALRAALQSGPDTAIVDRLIKEQFISAGRIDKLAGAVSRKVSEDEPTTVFKHKDRLFRRLLIEGQECPLGAISSAVSEQKRGQGGVSIGEILVRKGMLDEPKRARLRAMVEDHFYRHQAALLCGSQGEGEAQLPDLIDFEVLEEIGRGGMGIIYRARQKGLDRIVALKVLHMAQSHGTKVARFKREAKALTRLRHPNIVSILQVGEEQGVHFFSMELIEGRTLEQVFDLGEQPLDQRLELVLQVCQGLAYAHDKGILHRDIKPANIILDSKGVPKITDFGLARNLNEDTLLTRDGAILGTPFYMSPEQIKGNRAQIGPQTDQFALGVLLYEAATGELPFHGNSSVEIYHKILNEEPVPIERMAEHAPDGLGLIQRKAMSKSTGDRYATVTELADDLEALLRGAPISVQPPGLTRRAYCQLLCHRGKLVAACMAALCLLTGAIWWRNLRSQPTDPVVSTPAEQTRPDPGGSTADDDERKAQQAAELDALKTKIEHAMVRRNYKSVHLLAARIRQLKPRSAKSHMYDARAYWLVMQGQNRTDDAGRVIRSTTQALALNDKLVQAHALQGRTLRVIGKHRRAHRAFTSALRVDPNHAESLLYRALTLNALRRDPEALADLSQLLDLNPEHLDARYYRGQIYMGTGMTSRAIEDFSAYLRKRPDVGLAWTYRARCYEREEKLKLAIEDYRRSLEAGLPETTAKSVRSAMHALRKRLGGKQ